MHCSSLYAVADLDDDNSDDSDRDSVSSGNNVRFL
jgi:hypothetical protein